MLITSKVIDSLHHRCQHEAETDQRIPAYAIAYLRDVAFDTEIIEYMRGNHRRRRARPLHHRRGRGDRRPADYVDRDGRRIFPHTEVDRAFQRRGLATILVAEALRATREAGLRVVPACSMVADYIDQHPEFADIADPY